VRRHWLRSVRWGFAAVVLAGLTAAFVDFRGLVPAPLAHWLAAVQFVPAAVALATGLAAGLIVLGLLAVTALGGRVYCSVLCPLGILQDVIARLAALVRRGPRRLPYRPAVNWLRHLVFWGTIAGVLAGAAGFTLSLVDPYSNFGRIASGLVRPVITLTNNAVVGPANAAGLDAWYRVDVHWANGGALHQPALFLLLVVILVVWRGRFYCNTLCPVGTLLGWIARHAAWRLAVDESACTKCGDCLRVCKAQCIDLRGSAIDFSRCVACYNCVSACDQHGIIYRAAWSRRKSEAGDRKPETPDPQRRAFLASTAVALVASTGATALLRGQSSSSGSARGAAAPVAGPLPGHEASRGICPPGAAAVDRFLDRCTACQLCISACPTHVLQPAFLEYGFAGIMKPRLDYAAAFCNFDCRRCAEVCPDSALTLLPLAEKQVTRLGIARLDLEKCVVKAHGKDCAACSEHCPTKAVDTVPYGDNLRLPQMHDELCIGCGACQFACPVRPERAITVHGHRRHDRAEKRIEKKAEAPQGSGDFPF